MCLSEGILKERRALVTGSSVAGLTLKGLPKGAQPSAKGRGSVWRHKDSFLHPLILSLWSHLQEPGGPLTKGSWSESVECPLGRQVLLIPTSPHRKMTDRFQLLLCLFTVILPYLLSAICVLISFPS